jgi:DNA replication protein DnaC
MVPPMYLDTDERRLSGLLRAEIQNWTFGPLGLGFVGRSGAGKTRAAISLLKREHEEGRNVFFLSATDLALNSANQFADNPAIREISRSILKLCRSAEILLLDDLAKGRMTDRAESELYDVLEYRTSHRIPTIWTSNSDGPALLNMLSPDRGEAVIRRIGKEFSIIVKV